MFWKKLVTDYLRFDKKDRIGALFIVTVIGGSLLLPPLFAPEPVPFQLEKDSVLVLAMDSLQRQQRQKPGYSKERTNHAYHLERSSSGQFSEGELFPFDPNTASPDDWQRLGLNTKTSKTISNYVGKGGRFYKPEDLQKIWGMPEGFYNRVKAYIRIPSVKREYPLFTEKQAWVKEERKRPMINVNEADTSELILLPGIGSKLSARIIAFREKLGGFYSVEQVGETYGLPDSTFQKIKARLQVDAGAVRKININTATKDDLKAHPYIKWQLANVIVEYRNQHGPFKNLEEIKNIVLIDEEAFQKMAPYLSL
jgi:competence ComEA-like helix-hairpin-helix protein